MTIAEIRMPTKWFEHKSNAMRKWAENFLYLLLFSFFFFQIIDLTSSIGFSLVLKAHQHIYNTYLPFHSTKSRIYKSDDMNIS